MALIQHIFAIFGFRRRNMEWSKENGQKLVKGNVDIEVDPTNTMSDQDHINTLSHENPITVLADGVANEDLISALPNDILSATISFLTMRDAVKTSLLSKRWRFLYASLSEANFDLQTLFNLNPDQKTTRMLVKNCVMNKRTLVHGVDKFLKLYRSPKLHSFRISFCYDNRFGDRMRRWIDLVVRMGIEKLDLMFVCAENLNCGNKDMWFIFHWERLSGALNLKHLRLHSCLVKAIPSCELNGLTTLDLNYIVLVHNKISHILGSCSNLELLKMRGCKFWDKLSISGLTRLKFLGIYDCLGLKEIALNAINLTTFEFCDGAAKKLTFSCVPKLENVFFRLHFTGVLSFVFSNVAIHLPQLKILRISTCSLWVEEIVKFPYVLSIKQLELFVSIHDGFDLVKIIAPLLRACPCLQKLDVVMPYPLDCERRVTEEPPQYIHTQLEEVYISGFFGSWNHIDFAVYLLKSAVMLKRIIIDSRSKLYSRSGHSASGNSNIWSAEVRKLISDQLQGRNMSGNTEVIIR